MSQRKRIGIYGGTFDPLHFGHLNLAIQIRELRNLDEVWFCPVQISPHKQKYPPTSIEHRLKMLKLVIERIPGLSITEVEVKREGPSYTIETLKSLLEAEKNNPNPPQFSFIMGDDAIPSFCQWHQPERIVELVPLWIGCRVPGGVDPKKWVKDPKILRALEEGMTSTRLMDISATDIRERLSKKMYCGHLIPEKVIDYIYKNQLYL